MIIKKFEEIADETVFKLNGIEYRKVAAVKISCCKSINAVQLNNEPSRVFIQPSTDVEVNE